MANENITFDKLPQAVGYLTEQVERIHKIVAALQPQTASMISRSSAAILSKNLAALDSILAICISSRSFCILAYLTLYPAKQA